MASSALVIGHYFLSLQDAEAGDTVSNLKLQKLLYYAQGYHVALHGVDEPLFRDAIYAWKHGPVVQTVYKHFAPYGASALPACQMPRLPFETAQFLDEIYRVYGRFSAWALREMTHRESPWLDHYDDSAKTCLIPLHSLRTHFINNVQKTETSGLHRKAS